MAYILYPLCCFLNWIWRLRHRWVETRPLTQEEYEFPDGFTIDWDSLGIRPEECAGWVETDA